MSEVPLKQQWLQMGVELEGSWTRTSRQKVAEGVRGAKAVKDASVHIGVGDPGEIITRPHADINALISDVEEMYPDQVNDTCGMHVHASFTPMNGSVIASRDFYDYFKESWDKWGKKMKLPSNHEFWRRLSGTNKNTRDEFVPEVQLRGNGNGAKGSNARYTMLNFYSWEIHRTVECRLLPMFADKSVSVQAIQHLAHIYDSYLNEHGFQAISLESSTQIRGERVVETYKYKTPETTPHSFEAKGFFPRLEIGEHVYYSIPDAEQLMLPFKKDTGKQTP